MEYVDVNPQIECFINRHAAPGWGIEENVTSFIDLTYIFKGRAYYTIDGKVYEASEGDLLCIPKGSRRSAVTDPDHLMISYALNIHLYDLKGKEVHLPFPLVSHIGEPDELMALYNELAFECLKKSTGYEMKLRGLVLMILHYYFRCVHYKQDGNSIDKRIRKALDYILAHLDKQIEVEELAAISGVTAAYFGTLFKKNMGASVKEYINRMKINNAENILLSGEFTVQEAAFKCGFEDIYYFSKLFKRIKGFPPSRIRFEIRQSRSVLAFKQPVAK